MVPCISVDVAIIGAGTAGLFALREVRRARRTFVLIDHGPLGTTCARVGCMPSKVALHEAHLWSSRQELKEIGVSGQEDLKIDIRQAWANLRKQRDYFSNGAAQKARQAASEHFIDGSARFVEPTVLEVESAAGRKMVIAKSVIIATGSSPAIPKWLDPVIDRVITTDNLFEMSDLPESIGVLGLGAIGMEMGLALSRLGIKVVGADVALSIAGMSDPVINERAISRFGKEIKLWLGNPASVELTANGVWLRSGNEQEKVDLLLSSMGRTPNLHNLNLANAGFPLDSRGVPIFDSATLQIGKFPVFIAGDANGTRQLMHEATDEGIIAGLNAVRMESLRFRRKVQLGIAFTDPDIATVGTRFDQLDQTKIVVGTAEGNANGRARVIGSEESLLRIYADAKHGRLLGAAMIAAGGEHLAHLLAWSIQRGELAEDLLQMPFYHPVLEEMLKTALQDIVRKLPGTRSIPVGLVLENP